MIPPHTPPTDEEYERCVAISERIAWTVDEILGPHQELDFSRPFLPEALVHLADTPLTDAERLRLNHIRANSYLNLFVFIEESIVATAMRHAQAEQFGSPAALRALLRFADEEIKHQQLFRRFRAAFERGFGMPCAVVENAIEVAGFILRKSPLGVMLVTLHLELMTQQHYVGSVRDGAAAEALEPLFRSMLKHHWLEESQHARIDALEIAKLTVDAEPAMLSLAIDDYVEILMALDQVLARQTDLDLETFERALGRSLAAEPRARLRAGQHRSYRQAFLLDGLDHPQVLSTLRQLADDADQRLAAMRERLQ